MGQPLDSILKEQVIEGPETISATYETPSIWIENREAEYAIQATYDNGINVDMVWSLEASNDEVTWAEVTDSQVAFSDPSGSILFDLAGSGFSYVRVRITVNAGSMDLQQVLYVGKRRH